MRIMILCAASLTAQAPAPPDLAVTFTLLGREVRMEFTGCSIAVEDQGDVVVVRVRGAK